MSQVFRYCLKTLSQDLRHLTLGDSEYGKIRPKCEVFANCPIILHIHLIDTIEMIRPLFPFTPSQLNRLEHSEPRLFRSAMESAIGVHAVSEFDRTVRACFGASLSVICSVWILIEQPCSYARGMRRRHLLWALHFLKVYDSESASATYFRISRPTWRKWVWEIIGLLNQLDLVSIC